MNSQRLTSVVALVVCLVAARAWAVPAFARQTGMSCSSCHTVFPELTPFGRAFKAGAYTMTTKPQVTEGGGDDGKRTALEMPSTLPLGVMAVVGYTHTQAAQQVAPSGPPARNDEIALPQQFSIFYAGKIAPKVGAFVQLTYDAPGDHIGFDNTDIRFAHAIDVKGKSLIIGATVNNSPTVSDLWNSTPAWGAPYTSSASAATPASSTLIEGKLAQSVAGGGLYAFFNGWVYGEFDVYRSAPLGISIPYDASTGATNIIDGVLSYWRLAGEKQFGNHSISIGTFGLSGSLMPGGPYTDNSTNPPTVGTHPLVPPGDHYTDIAADLQYQYIGEQHIFSLTATYIHESQWLTATNAFGNSDNLYNELHSFKASASYVFERAVGARVTFSTLRGTSDDTLYGGQGPRSTTLTGELFYTPWHNVKLGAAYTSYLDFNGAATNYDGAGRNAADNNTIYAYLWVAF
jgi:hypothetical protein